MNTHDPITEKTEYGTNEIGTPYMSEGRCWHRLDVYTSDRTGEVHHEDRFAAGPLDRSPMARPMYAGKGNCSYHPKCFGCWGGHSHTLDYHQKHGQGSWD